MDSVKKYHELPSVWVKAWVIIGVVGAVFVVFVLLNIGAYTAREMERKSDCEAGTREDCDPSFVWTWNDIAQTPTDEEVQAKLKQEADAKLDVEYENGMRTYQTSDQAPTASGVEIGGAELQDNWYHAAAGTRVTLTVKPEGEFSRVSLFVHPKETLTPGLGIFEGAFNKQNDGTYTLDYRVPANLSADLEVRVQSNADDYGSVFVQIRAD